MRCISASCAWANSPRVECVCRCDGDGHGNGHRWITRSLFSLSVGFSTGVAATRLTTHAAIAILNQNDSALVHDLSEGLGHTVEEAVAAGPFGHSWLRRRRRASEHWLCTFLEELANSLEKLGPAELVTALVKRACDDAKMGPIGTIAAVAAVEKVTQILSVTAQFASPLDQAVFLLRVTAVAACPDLDNHDSLERTWASKIAGELASEEMRVQLSRPM